MIPTEESGFESENRSEKINTEIADRSDCFYWQTDRKATPEEAGAIWTDRHRYFTDDRLLADVNRALTDDVLISLEPLDLESPTSQGNVNSVRSGTLRSGTEVVIRNHPTAVVNAYFHVESLASERAKWAGIPSYDTLAIHDLENVNDHAFQVIEKLPGTTLKTWLEAHPQDEDRLLEEVGMTMARLHRVKVEGFGPFDNVLARSGRLRGLHDTYEKAVMAGMSLNCGVLSDEGLLTSGRIRDIESLFKGNALLNADTPVLVHNDFADWNLLTDGKNITGVIDFDECVGGDPVSDIACWSTFFEPERLGKMLAGYRSETELLPTFEERFELLRLRYLISKMTLRIRRYRWQPTQFMREKIEIGKAGLESSLKHFGI